MPDTRRPSRPLLIAILIVAALLRVPGVFHGIPYIHSDRTAASRVSPATRESRRKDTREEARGTALLTEDDLDYAARNLVHALLERFIVLKRSVRARPSERETVLWDA